MLRDLLPEAFVDNVFDPAKAASVLGIAAVGENEKYGLSWAGKAEAVAALQVPSHATLVPDLEASIDYENARHAVIEGDNLEVLRLLQRSYGGRVKMIYIDPPYNTGGDFIYNDDFRHGLDAYLRFSGQLDDRGNLKSSETEVGGRYHSQWLSMMYPRLALARNLLRSDGVIFVSIDDHEVHNLRLLMDEVFGPENFVASVIWQKVYSPKNTARHFSEDHDYVLVYARDGETWVPGLLPRTSDQDIAYRNPDDDPRGPWKASDLSARNHYSKGTYEVTAPSGRVLSGPPAGRYWSVSEEKFREMDADGRIWWGEEGDAAPAIKRFLSEVMEGRVPQTFWAYGEAGHNQEAKKELLKRVTFESSDSVFDTPKPTRLVRRMLTLATTPADGDVVLDFFAGSGTTGEAVLQANAEDGGDRRFILVQAPERTGYDDFDTVADITRARLRAAAAEFAPAGFRALSLARSNFKFWDPEAAPDGEEALAEQVELFADSLADGATDAGIVIEVLLKEGIPIDVPLRPLELGEGETVAVEADGIETVICLTREIGESFDALVDGVIERGPGRAVFLERAFAGQDAAKSNLFYRLNDAGIALRTV